MGVYILVLMLEFVCSNQHYVVKEPIDPLGLSQVVLEPFNSYPKARKAVCEA